MVNVAHRDISYINPPDYDILIILNSEVKLEYIKMPTFLSDEQDCSGLTAKYFSVLKTTFL